MKKVDNNDVQEKLKKLIDESSQSSCLRGVSIKENGIDGGLDIATNFQPPHLDVTINVQGDGEFTASYSNGNYSEHWNTKSSSDAIAEAISKILISLVKNGATQTDRFYKGELYSSTTEVSGADITTDVKKINPFVIKKKVIKVYPPVSNT